MFLFFSFWSILLFFSIFCAKNFLFDCAAETHLQQRHTWLESSAHLAVHINLIFNLLPVWLVWICLAVETSFSLRVLGVDQFNLWSSCFNCFFFFFGFLIACMFANHKRRETHKEPMCNCEFTDEIPLNLKHTWTHSNHRAPLLSILNVLLASSMRNQIDIPNKCS